MKKVVAAVIERPDRRILIGQRRRQDSSPLKWEFPGGKVRGDEDLEAALRRRTFDPHLSETEKAAMRRIAAVHGTP